MIFMKPSFEILKYSLNDLNSIETAGRVCYRSQPTDVIARDVFIRNRIKAGHESIIEHSSLTVEFICDRGISHELVRHRLCAFSQESTRYCAYKENVAFIIPPWVNVRDGEHKSVTSANPTNHISWLWAHAMAEAEDFYLQLLKVSLPQEARSVLPTSTKTDIIVTTNFREWRHILNLRTSKAAHPQMRELMIPLHRKLVELFPVIFEDITYET